VLKRSRVGGIVINKETAGGSPHFNRVVGADAALALGKSLTINSFVAKTSTPGKDGQDMSWYGRIAYRNPEWNVYLNYLDVQDNFNPEVGFVQRKGVRATKAYFSPTPRPGRFGIRLLEPMFIATYVTDQGNRLIGRTLHSMLGTTLDDGSFINVIYQKNMDVLDVPFQIQPAIRIPVGKYNYDEWDLTYNTSPARRVYERFKFIPEQFYGGHRKDVSAAVGVRVSDRFASELQYRRNDVDLPVGAFVVNLGILRFDYAFSPKVTIRSLTQYNSSTHEVTNNIRFNLIYRPGSDLYVVYSDLKQTGLPQDVFEPSDRQLVVKLTYLLAR